ncbi:ABC transporter ATP-binding protein [Rhodovarius crocodyli]|uniref:ABC transporter ATP-binding protein n=1 Tax=Rhodovarius crocodyli TaxID=1979269 RepID=A0A437MIQ5_9PROT|nr:ABC transporter ATP-binding protein [Rhodovarius crocodyli]RVT97538.1 ABC transporter ATP-binding protein [Rhodovarius crocodyli]
MAAIHAEGLRVEFPLYHHSARSLKKSLVARSQGRVMVQALRGLGFEIGGGERVALVGPNGSGKSTLLRTLAGIYQPCAGRLRVEGGIGSMIDPMAGMDQFLTGRENIMLRGLYKGLSDRESRAVVDRVVAFSGLGEAIDLPVRGYSAGMNIRLAFAMATEMAPDILLMDEWFLAGDEDFMRRAETRLAELVRGAEIMVLATHDMAVVRQWCNRVIRLEQGVITADTRMPLLVAAE